MRWPRVLRLRLRSLLSRDQVDRELDEELQYHLDRQVDELVAGGMAPADARLAALRAIGRYEQRREECRDMRGLGWLEDLAHDVRYSVRQLRAHPGFASTAVIVLALGLCASVSLFAFVDAALVKPLPYRDPARLLAVYERVPSFEYSNLSYPDYVDWKRSNTTFQSLDAYDRSGFLLKSGGGTEPVRGARVSDGFFRTLGATPALGRDFRPGEDLPNGPRLVMLTYASWQQRFAARPDIIGSSVTLNDFPYTIVGVLPREFHFAPAEPAEFWTTLHPESECDLRRSCHGMYGVGRLKPGVTMAAALDDVKAIAARLEQRHPDSNRGQGANVRALADAISGDPRPVLLVLLAGAGLLLLIAGINVASLLLVRSESRARELAVRTALGASRGRLARQFATEALLLVAAGCGLGVLGARAALPLLLGLIPEDMLASMSYLRDLGLDARVLGFAVAVSATAWVLLAVVPARHVLAADPRGALAESGRGSAGTLWRRLGARLVTAELALAVVLLVAAGLLGRSLYLVLQVHPGLEPDHLVALTVAAPDRSYGKPEHASALGRLIAERVSGLPGVTSAGVSSDLPISGWGNTTWFRVLGRPWHGEHNETPERSVSTDYFRTLGARLIKGRPFTASDRRDAPAVAIINRAMAREYFPNQDPVGQSLTYLSDPPRPMAIVGVVEDVMEGQIDTVPRPVLYRPFEQSSGSYFFVVARTTQAEAPLVTAVSQVIRQVDPDVVTFGGQTMSERIARSPAAYLHRSSAWLVSGFALIALALSVIGLYGVVAYSVGQRTREIGIRMALGAEKAGVYRLVLGEAGRLAVFGIAIGLACALAVTRLMQGLLFGVAPWDAATLAGVATVLGGCALVASYLPARRAASIDAAEALRSE
jgi:predicted permease